MKQEKPRVLLTSYVFWPSLGGLELVAEHLARGLQARDHKVEVLTFTPAPEVGDRAWPFRVTRRPGLRDSLAAFRRADVVISRHLSLRTCWPVLVIRRPLIIWHATWYPEDEKFIARTLRRWIMRRATNIANSQPICSALEYCDGVVHPGYDDSRYRNETPWDMRPRSFVYIGRLGLEKGVDLLIRALAAIPGADLTVIGSGPAEAQLKSETKKLGVSDRVNFVGRKDANEINALLNQHKVMVAPSRYDEPFGTVALEG
ncbi:glycosyltransferase family 4 protein, partial [Pseudophaeobacter sp.]|uniref:glycosyltransferase family 4 protein n=1 Tax=Pseudophaeobacter sp. TaxID=1971739 RepID=UPI003297C3F3